MSALALEIIEEETGKEVSDSDKVRVHLRHTPAQWFRSVKFRPCARKSQTFSLALPTTFLFNLPGGDNARPDH